MDEFELIRRYFSRDAGKRGDVVAGIGDDAALVEVPRGQQLAVTTDTMLEGVHFPADAPAHAVGYRALATNLSDLAAMGAEPAWATLALALPSADKAWFEDFSAGLFELADEFHVALIGGDITRGPLAVTVAAYGFAPPGRALRRAGARAGDCIFVTGLLGAGAAGLSAYPSMTGRGRRYLYPRPRVAEGLALRGRANAAIDISDGLLADLGHVCAASGVGATLRTDAMPMATSDVDSALNGGDDYELCFTIDSTRVDELKREWKADLAALTPIGAIESEAGVRCLDAEGREWRSAKPGYRHFKA